MDIPFKFLAGPLLCVACATPQPAPEPLAEIPIEIRHGMPTVDVRLSGQSFKLFLDLAGHKAISLTSSELGRANVRILEGSNRFMNSLGQTLESRRFVARDVVLGSLPLGDLEGGESLVGDMAPPDQNGYIGMPVLGRYLLVLDYPARRVRIYESGDAAAFVRECGANTFSVSLVNGTARSVGTTEFGDRLFLWDTGTTSNFIRPSARPPDKAAGRIIDDGPPVATIDKLILGNRNFGPQEFRLHAFAAPAVDAYLGAGLFASRRVCLDIPRGKGGIA